MRNDYEKSRGKTLLFSLGYGLVGMTGLELATPTSRT